MSKSDNVDSILKTGPIACERLENREEPRETVGLLKVSGRTEPYRIEPARVSFSIGEWNDRNVLDLIEAVATDAKIVEAEAWAAEVANLRLDVARLKDLLHAPRRKGRKSDFKLDQVQPLTAPFVPQHVYFSESGGFRSVTALADGHPAGLTDLGGKGDEKTLWVAALRTVYRQGQVAEAQAWAAEISRLTALVNTPPPFDGGPYESFHRLWCQCCELADKAAFQAVFRYMMALERHYAIALKLYAKARKIDDDEARENVEDAYQIETEANPDD